MYIYTRISFIYINKYIYINYKDTHIQDKDWINKKYKYTWMKLTCFIIFAICLFCFYIFK